MTPSLSVHLSYEIIICIQLQLIKALRDQVTADLNPQNKTDNSEHQLINLLITWLIL